MHLKCSQFNQTIRRLGKWLIPSSLLLSGLLSSTLLAQSETVSEPSPSASQRISYSAIERLIDSGVHSEAARRLENHLARHPHDRTARRMLARTYLLLEEYYKAYEQARRLLAERPDDRDAEEWARTAREQIERIYPERVQRYQTVLRRNPQDHITRRALVEIMVQHGDIDEAIVHFLIIFADDPENPEYQRHYARMLAWADRYEESIVEYQRYLAIEAISDIDREQARYELAAVYAWAGQPGAAARLLRQVIEKTPDNLSARVLLGDLFRWNDDSDVARQIYEEVLAIEPEHEGALNGLKELENLVAARAYQAERLSIDAMERRLAENPDDQEVRLQLARLYGVASRYPDAEVLFAEYLRRDPEHTPVRREYALALSVQEKYPQALEQLYLYLEAFPEDVNVRAQVANIHMWQGDLESAREMVLSTLELTPQNIELLWNLARIQQMNREWEDALKNYRTILEIDPNYRAPVAQIRQILNHPAYRIESLERRIREEPRNARARLELASIFIDLDRYFEAQTQAQTVLGIEPENQEAQRLLDRANAQLVVFRERQITQLQERLRETPDDHESRLELARLLRGRGNFNESARQFAIYLQHHTEDHGVRREYAQVLSWQPERRSEALAEMAELVNRMPDSKQLQIQFLQLRFWTGEANQRDREEITRMRRELEQTLDLNPNDIEALLLIANVHELHEDWELALRRYQHVIEIDSENQLALDGIQRIETLPEYRIARMRDEIQQRGGHIEPRLDLARFFMVNNRYFDAQEEAQAILRMDANHREARDIERRASERLDELRRSQMRSFEERLRLNPEDAAARLGLARLLRDDGNYAQSARQYRFYLRIQPEDHRVRREYARVLAWQESPDARREAIAQLDQLIELFPEDNTLRLQRLQARAWSGMTNERDRNEQDRIRRALEDELDFNPYNVEARMDLANLHILRQDFDSALRQYRSILNEEPFNVQAQQGIRELQNLPEYRLIHLRSEIERDPRNVFPRMRLARFFFEQERYAEAREAARSVLSIDRRIDEARELERRAGERMTEENQRRMQLLEDRLREYPQDAAARLELARLFRDGNNYTAAARQYRFYLRLQPEDYTVRREFAQVLSWQDDRESRREAVAQLDELALLFPEDNSLRLQRLQARSWAGQMNARDREELDSLRSRLESDVAFDPHDTSRRLDLATLHMLRQDYERAMHQYRAVLEVEPYNQAAVEGIREVQNLPEFRIQRLREEVDRDPRNVETRMRLTRFFYDQGRMDEARTEARAVLSLDRRNEEARDIERNAGIRADRERGERLSALRAELRQNPTDLNLHLELAQVLRDEGSYAEALRRYQLYLRANPFDMEIRREYAQILSWTEDNQEQAVHELRELLDFYPEDIDMRIQYARLLTFSREHWPEAEKELLELTLFDSTNLEIPLMLADLYRFQGRYNEARAIYQEIIELSAIQWQEESRQAPSRRYRSNRRNLWLEDSVQDESERRFVETRPVSASNQNHSMGQLGLGDSLYYESRHGSTRRSRPIYLSTRTSSYLTETESFYIRREVEEVLPTRELEREVRMNGQIARPLPGLEDHFRHAREGIIAMNTELRPQFSAYIGSMVDNEDYSEFLIGARYFHFLSSGTRLHVGIDFGRHREKGFDPSMINSMSLALGIRGKMTPRVTGAAEIGITRYSRGISKTTVSGMLSGTYDLTPSYDLTLSYEKFDAIKEVKTVSSLASGIDVDRIALAITSNPAYNVAGRPFHQRIFFDGRVSFANLSDNNNQTAFVLRPYYRMRDDPTIDLSLGWRGLSYSRQSPLYWSPSNYNGPFLQARIAGRGPWERATYDVRAEFLITNESGGASRSLSAYLQHAFSESFFAGLSLTLSESPRDNDTYRYGAILLDALWRF